MTPQFHIKIWDYHKHKKAIEQFLSLKDTSHTQVEKTVLKIIESIKKHGDKALSNYTKQFDGITLKPSQFPVPPAELTKAYNHIPSALKQALALARKRVTQFHQHQIPKNWTLREQNKNLLAQRFIPLNRVGIYIPGGIAAYPSTVLMNVIPAQLAGVKEIIITTPPDIKGTANQAVLATARLLGIKNVFRIGGAQAIAALAFGTKTIPAVDKIVGPGNIYVATAKKMVFGIVDIDMIAGPTEVVIIADHKANPHLIAADMLAQAEHAPDASAIVLGIKPFDTTKLLAELELQTATAPRQAIIKQSLNRNGAIILVNHPNEAVKLANLKAPEHLEIMTRNPEALAAQSVNAGAIFLGQWSPEAIGDYVAGPNHTLPTDRTARFESPLNVLDFMKGQHIVDISRKGFEEIAQAAIVLAREEQLFAHANSIEIRKNKINSC